MLLRSEFWSLQNNYGRKLELSLFLILTEIIWGRLIKASHQNLSALYRSSPPDSKSFWTPEGEKARPRPAVFHFPLLFAFKYLRCDSVLTVWHHGAGFCRQECPLFPGVLVQPRPALPAPSTSRAHGSHEVLQLTQVPWAPTNLLHLWLHSKSLFQHHTSCLPSDLII